MSDSEYGPLLGTIRQFLEEIQFRYAPPQVIADDAGRQRFRVNTGITGDRGTFKVAILGDETSKVLAFYAISPLAAPPSRVPQVTELITRINYGLSVGNFELGCDDGEVRFKTSVPTDGTPMTYSLLRTLLYTAGDMMEAFTPALEAVITGEATPQEANTAVRNQEKAS
jgi:hypothetical protein